MVPLTFCKTAQHLCFNWSRSNSIDSDPLSHRKAALAYGCVSYFGRIACVTYQDINPRETLVCGGDSLSNRYLSGKIQLRGNSDATPACNTLDNSYARSRC